MNDQTAQRTRTIEYFPLSNVRLLEGPFLQAQERDGAYLLSLQPDRFLHNFRKFAGLSPKGPLYGGWESRGLAGHSLGHYLSACSLMYAGTGDARFRERVDYIISELKLCQSQRTDGYIGAIPEGDRVWSEVSQGDIRAQNFDLNGAWVPWYNLHKLYAGLIDASRLCGSAEAKEIVTRLGDWALEVTASLDDEKWQQMLIAEHGGMNEAMADLAVLTGKTEFLRLAAAFNDRRVLDPLAQGEDRLTGLHANTQIPKVIGAARQYELTGASPLRTMAENFWDNVVGQRSYVIGGNSDREHFFAPEESGKHLGPQTAETCNTYNMLKLTRHLFAWEPSARRMDYYERALYNHILASQDPEKGMMTYFVSLKPGHFKVYNTPEDSFWCCTGSGMENHARYGETIYGYNADSLYINLFIPSVLTWEEKALIVRQETRFPEEGATRLIMQCPQPVSLTLKVRRPSWAQGMTVMINGVPQEFVCDSDSYATVTRNWTDGDTVEIRLPMSLSVETLSHTPHRVAFLYGPIVLAGALGAQDLPDLYPANHTRWDGLSTPEVPALVTERDALLEKITPFADQPLTFQTAGIGRPTDITLLPFYRLHHQRYNIYWDTFNEREWAEREAQRKDEEAQRRAVEARTVDAVYPGEQQPEVEHQFQGESTHSGALGERKWRDATDGGWFSYEMKVLPDIMQVLRCTYWGDDASDREFAILIDGVVIAVQILERNRPGEFFTVEYPLPVERTQGRSHVNVRFQAHPGKTAGGVFGCLILKAVP